MKAQFFVLGAIIIASLLFIGLPITGYLITPMSEDINYLSENLEKEFPHAINLAIDSGDPEKLKDFTLFVDNQVTNKNAVFRNLWVVTQGQGSNLNVTVGNFLDEHVTVVLNISNTIEMLYMPAGTTDSVMFFGVPSQITLRATSPYMDSTMNLQRSKVNLYCFYSIERSGDLLRKEIIA
jgi:hypothetical protein